MSTKTKSKLCRKCGAVYVSVLGEPASKANSRKLVMINNRLVPIKSQKARDLEKTWGLACPRLDPIMTDDVVCYFWLTYASRRPDLDESLIMDLIQGKLIANDRQIKQKHVYWLLDKDKAGAEVLVRALTCDVACGGADCLMEEIDP